MCDKPSYKPQKDGVNQAKNENALHREFNQKDPMKMIVIDLTYVKFANKWFYVCFILDLLIVRLFGIP